MKHADVPLCLLQTFLRVRANRHTRLNGRLMHVCGLTVVFHCCWLRLSLRESSVTSAVLNGFEFFLKSKEWEFPLFTLMRPVMCFVHHHPPLPHQSFRYHPFSHHISTGLAPTRAEELLTFELWPLDMLTVDDLCWCRCYVKSAPLRPHSAGAHLDCTQAGKTHREALFFIIKLNCNEQLLSFASSLSI